MTQKFNCSEIAVCSLDITPEKSRPVVGYLSRQGSGQLAANSNLQASITALRNAGEITPTVVVIAIDSLFIDQDFIKDLVSRLERPELTGRILAVASHSHGAPNLQNRHFMNCPPDFNYKNGVLDKLKEAIKNFFVDSTVWSQIEEIRSKVAPYDKLVCRRKYGFHIDLRNRRFRRGYYFGQNLNGPTDPFVRCIEILDKNGIQAIWWSYAAHPAFSPEPNNINSDFPGLVRLHLQLQNPSAAIAFFPGLSGSVIPFVSSPPRTGIWWRDLIFRLPLVPGLGIFSQEEFKKWTRGIVDALSSAKSEAASLKNGIRFATDNIKNVFGLKDTPFDLNLAVLDLGMLRLLFLSGEPVAHWQPLLSRFIKNGGIMSGYMAGAAGYLATKQLLSEGGYEVEGFKTAFDVKGFLSPDIESKVIKSFQTLVKDERL